MARTRKTAPVEPTVNEYPPFDGIVNVDAGAGGDWIKGAQLDGYVLPEGVSYEDHSAAAGDGESAQELSENAALTAQPTRLVRTPAKKATAKPAPKKKAPALMPGKVACTGLQKDGVTACKMPVIKGLSVCFNHMNAEQRSDRGMPEQTRKATGPRWSSGTFDAVELSVKKGSKVLMTGTARVILRRDGDKLSAVVEG